MDNIIEDRNAWYFDFTHTLACEILCFRIIISDYALDDKKIRT